MSKRMRRGRAQRRRHEASRATLKGRLALAGGLGLGATLGLSAPAQADVDLITVTSKGQDRLRQQELRSGDNKGAS